MATITGRGMIEEPDVIIVGAGFAGMYMLRRLRMSNGSANFCVIRKRTASPVSRRTITLRRNGPDR
jgi:NADH dehydrogenase FAD-containing subunit